MVSSISLAFLVLQVLMTISVPVLLFLWLRRRQQAGLRPVVVGAVVFFVFSQVLEKGLHYYVFTVNPETTQLLKNPYIYATYGGLAAGVFEEIGRYLGFTLLLKGYLAWRDGVAFGLGHGGLEAVLFGTLAGIQNLVFATLINQGTLEPSLGTKIPPEILAAIKTSMLATPPYMFLFAGFERLAALCLQIALSVMVLYSVKSRQLAWLIYAIAIHAVVDFPVALWQMLKFDSAVIELMLLGVAALSVVFIKKSKAIFAG